MTMKRTRRNAFAALLVVSVGAITYLHHITGVDKQPLRSIYNELHYIPLLAAALVLGVRGALFSFLLVFLSYLVYLLFDWNGTLIFLVDNFFHLIFPGLIAFILGFYVDRERRHRQQLEKEKYLSGLGRAAAAIVHDLKNPIFVIVASLARIREGRDNLGRSLKAAEVGARKLEAIVEGILDFAKPSGASRQAEDLRKTVLLTYDSCREKAEGVGIHLFMETWPNPLPANIDALQMERCFVNLLTNAVEASNKGQQVSISLRKQNKNAVVTVLDHGSGMDKDTVDHLFVPFYSKKNKGTGLGMVISKRIIEEHGGRIEVASRLGIGTRVSVYLPLRVDTVDGCFLQ